MVTLPSASTPWTWKIDFAMSRPIVVTACMTQSSESGHPTATMAPTCRWRSRPQHQQRTSYAVYGAVRGDRTAQRELRGSIWVGIPTAIVEPDSGFSGDGQPTWAYCG